MTGGTGMKKNIGIDIGGTKVLMGVVDGQGTVHACLLYTSISAQQNSVVPEEESEINSGIAACNGTRLCSRGGAGREESL